MLKQIIYKSYVLLLMAFTVWYGVFMYSLIFGFEGKGEAGLSFATLTGAREVLGTEEEKMFEKLIAEQKVRSETNLGSRVIDQPFIEGRFHHVGFEIQLDKASMCGKCHGSVPHNESKDLRSFLNMHAFYLACETCHATPAEDAAPWEFRWYDKDTGDIVPNPVALLEIEESYTTASETPSYPTFGNYGAKIVPGFEDNGEFKLLHGVKEITFVQRYIEEQEQLQPEKKSQMETVIHRKVANAPVLCEGCHIGEDQYISFEELGYPPTRQRELTNIAVVGMIRKYKDFYVPSFLRPGGRSTEE